MSCPRRSLFISLLLLSVPAWASDDDLFFKSIADVNEGELRFLDRAPDKPVHHHQNRITIDDASLETGWLRLEQCHAHLDAVPSSQILYREGFIRNLRILRSDGIDKSWVEGASVQMEGVRPGARLCISADTRALSQLESGSYTLRNGPYMRRFLDGYYPMRVSLAIHLDTDKVRFQDIQPTPQPGFQVSSQGRDIQIEALFEGRLRTEIRFDPVVR